MFSRPPLENFMPDAQKKPPPGFLAGSVMPTSRLREPGGDAAAARGCGAASPWALPYATLRVTAKLACALSSIEISPAISAPSSTLILE